MPTLTSKQHPDRRTLMPLWRKYRDLYTGGEQFCQNSAEYLARRQHEPPEVYRERLSRVYYENYIGSIIDWYAATLFRREPVIVLDGPDHKGRHFFNQFAENCDLRGTALSDFFRAAFIEAQVTGKSYVLIDFPTREMPVRSRAEEDQYGLSRAYLIHFSPEQLLYWERGAGGHFQEVLLDTTRSEVSTTETGVEVRTYLWLDTTRYQLLETRTERGTQTTERVLREGLHGLARLGQTPLFELDFTEGMWLMNRAAPIQLEHFNKSNALAWALTMGLFAMPVIYSEREFDQLVGESYYLQLGSQDRFGWTEPEGKVFEIAARNLDRLKDEIYRVCYLSHQAGGPFSKATNLSGLSKQRDYAVTQEVLRGFGDKVKDLIKKILRAIIDARQDELTVQVTGLDEFDIGDFSSDLADAIRLLELGIPSHTLRKNIHKKLALKYLCDASQETKDQIAREIDNSDK